MHSFICKKGTLFFYNSDLSGEVVINVDRKELRVEGSDILEFVAEYIRDMKISRIESAETEELLLGKV